MMNLFLPSIILFSALNLFSQNMIKPKVLIITTGGTIASKTNAPLIEGAQLIKAKQIYLFLIPQIPTGPTLSCNKLVHF